MNAADLLAALPPHLSERVRALSGGPAHGGFVLVWMRVAARAHDHPAIDAALRAGDALGLPVFVYHALSERYPYASDRHHRFILEGARDAQVELRARGLGTAFHLERPGHRGAHLKALAAQAALVVTEDLPVPPLTGWTARLTAAVSTPVWAVDCACVVPMLRVPPASSERAFRFRDDLAGLRAERLAAGWTDAPVTRPGFLPPLPFEPVEVATASDADLARLVAACDIDHGVGPVPDTPGGSVAGYARWAAFVEGGGLQRYASTRNDPAREGVSRMSAYLHYGHVSPFRLAREAAAQPGRGPAKYLDELLIWRELAHAWCANQRGLHRLGVLPDWAQSTLQRHAGDPRPAPLSWERLARGQTGDALWDACQRSLLRHGELHNNVRMTWGKALLRWTADPESARATLVDLNHRYALDGRDPSSYGGLYWCLGLFDRPFRPERPITGALRDRTTDWHAPRVRLEVYRGRVGRPPVSPPPRVAVVGAGISGLACARVLHDHGVPVVVFDAATEPGGRSRGRAWGGASIDPGAQFFTARAEAFRRHVESWVCDGVVTPWTARFAELDGGDLRATTPRHPRYVGCGDMGALARHLATGLDLRPGQAVEALVPVEGGWRLSLGDGPPEHADRVVLALPPAEARPLLSAAPGSRAMTDEADGAEMVPCAGLLLRFDAPPPVAFDAVRVRGDGPLAWLARDSSKPGRAPGARWVAHATPAWSAAHRHRPDDHTQAALLEAVCATLGAAAPAQAQLVRWSAARPRADHPPGPPCRMADDGRLGLCGDWLGGARVEGAWRSGVALAGRIMGTLGRTPG